MPRDPGFLFGPTDGWWDSARTSCPVVQPDGNGYRMWYYGREVGFPGIAEDDRTALPCGRTGTATSPDGLHWTKQTGPGFRGAVFDPSPDPERFDALQVGVGDVIRVGDEWRMYYIGARRGQAMSYGMLRTGWPTSVGLARSGDGLRWERIDGPETGAVLVHGATDAWDAYYVAFPRITPAPGGWRLTYSGGGPAGPPAIGLAESSDGIRWEKRGPILSVNPDPAACDARSVGGRCIVPHQGGFLMAYECVDAGDQFRIALASSGDGLRWERLRGRGRGGSALDHGAPGAFDDRAVGTPYLVRMPGGGLHLYYVGFSARGSGIGLAVCDGSDLTSWERYPFPENA